MHLSMPAGHAGFGPRRVVVACHGSEPVWTASAQHAIIMRQKRAAAQSILHIFEAFRS
jgi:hypothetical protein